MTIVDTTPVSRMNGEPNDYARAFVVTIHLTDPNGAMLHDVETMEQAPSPH